MMKNLIEILNESWKEFVDEETGEIVSMWIDDESEKPLQSAIQAIEEDPIEYKKKLDKEKSLSKKLDVIEDKYFALKMNIRIKLGN